MTSQKQLDANRRNSQKSTGPRPDAANAIAHSNIFRSLSHLQRRIDSADRAYRRNLDYLLKLQATRAQNAQTVRQPATEAIPDPTPQTEGIAQPQSAEALEAENGFVHPNPIS